MVSGALGVTVGCPFSPSLASFGDGGLVSHELACHGGLTLQKLGWATTCAQCELAFVLFASMVEVNGSKHLLYYYQCIL